MNKRQWEKQEKSSVGGFFVNKHDKRRYCKCVDKIYDRAMSNGIFMETLKQLFEK